jgi:hypothetical protein
LEALFIGLFNYFNVTPWRRLILEALTIDFIMEGPGRVLLLRGCPELWEISGREPGKPSQ